MQEKIIEHKTCKHCNSNFEITDKDLEFYEKISPVFTSSVIARNEMTKQSREDISGSPHFVRDDKIKDL
jgi:hypothetical protein